MAKSKKQIVLKPPAVIHWTKGAKNQRVEQTIRNVRSIFESGKLQDALIEMTRLKIVILGKKKWSRVVFVSKLQSYPL